jgi:cell division inhibitor SepF
MTYLGLVDDEYDDYEVYDDAAQQQTRPRPQPAEPEPVATSGIRTLRQPTTMETSGITMTPRPAVVRPVMPVQSGRVHVVEAKGFDDFSEIGTTLKNGQAVIVNLTGADHDVAYRIIDCCSGATYVLEADMQKVAKGVFLLTPANVEVSAEEKKRLQERGLYRA